MKKTWFLTSFRDDILTSIQVGIESIGGLLFLCPDFIHFIGICPSMSFLIMEIINIAVATRRSSSGLRRSFRREKQWQSSLGAKIFGEGRTHTLFSHNKNSVIRVGHYILLLSLHMYVYVYTFFSSHKVTFRSKSTDYTRSCTCIHTYLTVYIIWTLE